MNLDEARSLLGIDRSTDAATARRAYLRLLKQHPPERDPEGFKRVRTAYEAVQPFLRTAREPQVAEPPPTSPVPTVPMPPGAIQPEVVELAPLDEPISHTSAPSLSELFWNEEDPAARESVARAAVAREHSEEAYSLLLAGLAERASDEEQLRIAREAGQQGHSAFLMMIGQRWPTELTDAELQTLGERAQGSPDWAPVTCILIERDQAASAAHFALSELEREKRDPFAPRASTWWLTRIVAGLLGSFSRSILQREYLRRPCNSPVLRLRRRLRGLRRRRDLESGASPFVQPISPWYATCFVHFVELYEQRTPPVQKCSPE